MDRREGVCARSGKGRACKFRQGRHLRGGRIRARLTRRAFSEQGEQHVQRSSGRTVLASSRNIEEVSVAGATRGRGWARVHRATGAEDITGRCRPRGGLGLFHYVLWEPQEDSEQMGHILKGCLGLLSRGKSVGDKGGDREPLRRVAQNTEQEMTEAKSRV